ncbi:MAG: Glu-tRNA(Gln) amidotransferase subunit GatE [Euryarchaeota archaeon]|nr:Glu-tRNA(Gln) amidotransferase subunit GatE [Euryarchaeota archaeon]
MADETRGRHDYAALGFKCGLEIHQQLDTGKLFCRCQSGVVDVDEVESLTEFTIERRLRPTESELGEMDPAAAAEARRGLLFRYHGIEDHSCLVEADEEPPHQPDGDAIDITLTLAALTGARVVDEIEFMRKIVIDGSNTSGFQRTGLVALGGEVEGVGILTTAIEEDSCRKLDTDEEGVVNYTLDRLGVPLIEVATDPTIRDAQHAKEVAARIGALLRATGRVRRGLGTIRQDLNVSIACGDRVEIKGVQDLRSIPRVADKEIDRQLHMDHIKTTLHERGIDAARLDKVAAVDVTLQLKASKSKVVQGAMKRKGVVLALPLPGFDGLIGGTADGPRLGKEFAAYAKKYAGVRGVFHSDELPAYGIEQEEVDAVRDALRLDTHDGFVLAAESATVARAALDAVLERAKLCLVRLPREVRNALPDETTVFLRPLPGAARMYPETDVRPVAVTDERMARILSMLPERPEESVGRLVQQHKVSTEVAVQIVGEGLLPLYDTVLAQVGRPNELARLLLQTLPELSAEDVDTAPLSDGVTLVTLLGALDAGRFAKEALTDVARAYCQSPDAGVEGAISAAGAEAVDESEVVDVIARIVEGHSDFVKERGKAAVGPLMGIVMKELRGKADGALVSKVLAEEIGKRA